MVKSKAELSWSRNWKQVFSLSSLSTSLSLFLSSISVHFYFIVVSSLFHTFSLDLSLICRSLFFFYFFISSNVFFILFLSLSLYLSVLFHFLLSFYLSHDITFSIIICSFSLSSNARQKSWIKFYLTDSSGRFVIDCFFTIFELSDKSRISCFPVCSSSAKLIE